MKHLFLIFLLTACGMQISAPDEILMWEDYEYQVGDNLYYSFAHNGAGYGHIYSAWYVNENRGPGVLPNVVCSGSFNLMEDTLTVWFYIKNTQTHSGKIKDYTIHDGRNGKYIMVDQIGISETWIRTKRNDYIH